MLELSINKISAHKKKLILCALLLLPLFVLSQPVYKDHYEAKAASVSLSWGSTGDVVKQAQQKLKNWGYYNGNVDGVYGSQTYQAVIKFQKTNGLTADGIVGAQTFKALGMMKYAAGQTSGNNTSPSVSTSDDALLLARAIHAESESEPYNGKVAVGAVLLNRVNSPDFPNTLSSVITQDLALESLSNGRFASISPNNDSIRAAHDALNGWDPTYGCLYFWNPYKKVNPWVWSRQIVVQYGNHVFAK